MGASLSNMTEGANGSAEGPGLGDIPESCVAHVFMHLTPPEICNLARLNWAFRGAASSDAVWDAKLPPNYKRLLDLLPPERYLNSCKKDIFALISRPIPFDDGNKEVWVDRVTGGVCMSISAKAMSITGIEDRRYWNWVPTGESRLSNLPFVDGILKTERYVKKLKFTSKPKTSLLDTTDELSSFVLLKSGAKGVIVGYKLCGGDFY